MTHNRYLQSGQAIIYVILLGASVLGAALVANQNILVDILRTRRIEEASVAYYAAEGALEEKLLEIKQKGLSKTEEDKSPPSRPAIGFASVNLAPASKVKVSQISSDQLLPETDGILEKDKSVTIDAKPFQGKTIQILLDTEYNENGFEGGYKAAPGSPPEHWKIEVRTFDSSGKIKVIFYRKDVFRSLISSPDISLTNIKNFQIKPYGGDIKFKISTVDKSPFTDTSKKELSVSGSFGGSSRDIRVNIDELKFNPLPLFDFGLFSKETNLFAK